MAFKHAIKNQVMQRDGGLERIADDIIEVKAAQPIGFSKSVWMNNNQYAKLLGLVPERGETWVRKLAAGHVSQNCTPLNPSFFTDRSSSTAAAAPSCSGTVPNAMKRSARRATYSANPSLTMRAARSAISIGSV